MTRRMWALTWAVLCVAGLTATVGLQAASAPEAESERSIRAECREYIADIEEQIDKADWGDKGEIGILTFTPVGMDCGDELRDLLSGAR
ncbi:hypothetical protein [Streptomyces microflavus]